MPEQPFQIVGQGYDQQHLVGTDQPTRVEPAQAVVVEQRGKDGLDGTFERPKLQVYQHVALKNAVIKHPVDKVVLVGKDDALLPGLAPKLWWVGSSLSTAICPRWLCYNIARLGWTVQACATS